MRHLNVIRVFSRLHFSFLSAVFCMESENYQAVYCYPKNKVSFVTGKLSHMFVFYKHSPFRTCGGKCLLQNFQIGGTRIFLIVFDFLPAQSILRHPFSCNNEGIVFDAPPHKLLCYLFFAEKNLSEPLCPNL